MWSWGVGRFKANKGRQSQLCLEIISVCFSVKVGTKESPSVISTRKSWKTVWLQLFDWNSSDFASKILLILLLSHKSCLPFSPHHPGLPAIKVDRKQVPRELGRRVPPPFLGSEGATCKWYNMSFWKTSSSNCKCICVFQYQSVDQYSICTHFFFFTLFNCLIEALYDMMMRY